jgi:GWxTD domain-containing protein
VAAIGELQQPSQPATPTPSNYLPRWITEEVPDIATAEEQAAFHGLEGDQARESFIASFWLRRDPTPNTAENEFKEEYYRRIVIANQRYSSARPGSKTDRGRVLIRFGEPDEVQSLTAGSLLNNTGNRIFTFPLERWRYRFIEGLGNNVLLEFVDSEHNGEYRLSFDPLEKRILTPNPQ